MDSEIIYAIACSIAAEPAKNNIFKRLEHLSFKDVFLDLSEKKILPQKHIAKVYSGNLFDVAKKIYNNSMKKRINILDFKDLKYPKILREISNPPIILYFKGDLKNLKDAIAIVGTRKADRNSIKVADQLSSDLSQSGLVIVSGMATGIDRAAHLGALKSNKITCGVLANGLDINYPSSNLDIRLAIEKSEKSILLSEYPPEIYGGKWTFARRNRIISGLSLGTVVVKAAERSGALITAKYALEQNREVFACPGYAFDSSYFGSNSLIKEGAVLVRNSEDVLYELKNFVFKQKERDKRKITKKIIKEDRPVLFVKDKELPAKEYSKEEAIVVKILKKDISQLDEIIRLSKMATGKINELLIDMELSGKIYRKGNHIEII